MQYRTLGRTGIKVSPYCLGAMMFGAIGNTDHEDSIRIIHKAIDAGINFIDTADRYSQGESEEIVGKAICAAGAIILCSPPKCMGRWAMIQTSKAIHGAGSPAPWKIVCAACKPTMSTSIRSTGPRRIPISRKHFQCSPI